MTRPLVLGNGNILVGMDKYGRVQDFYFPYVGEENHANRKAHRVGIWVDGKFHWLSHSSWQKKLGYRKDSLCTEIVARNDELGIELVFHDIVHHEENIFIRDVLVKNLHAHQRDVRLFFHQDFEVSEGNIGNTVYYEPTEKSLVHYKGKRYFLMNGSVDGSSTFNEYATGLVGEYDKEGTYRDAEDGQLSNNPVEHGSVDSTLGLYSTVAGHGEKHYHYWICVGERFQDVVALQNFIKKKKTQKLVDATTKHWKTWANKEKYQFPNLSTGVVDLFKRSLLTIRTHFDNRGAIIASSDSDMLFLRKDSYNYMWPRDGALISRSLDRAGYLDLTRLFFEFCSRGVSDQGFMFHKYRPDGSLGSSWHSWLKEGRLQLPIQEDQVALILDALWKHHLQHGKGILTRSLFEPYIRKMADFMLGYMDKKTGLPKESYDLWEEKLGIHTFTCSTVFAGFRAAAHFEREYGTAARAKVYDAAAEKVRNAILKYMWDEELGYFIKGVYYKGTELCRDTTLDISSAYGVFEFGVLDARDIRISKSMEKCDEHLLCKTAIGGYARYTNDQYYRVDRSGSVPGNPWFITTLWTAEYHIQLAKVADDDHLKKAVDIFEWVHSHAMDTGILAEQLNPHTGECLSVSPLTWSHAGYVIAVNKYLEKLDELGICSMCNPPKLREKQELVERNVARRAKNKKGTSKRSATKKKTAKKAAGRSKK